MAGVELKRGLRASELLFETLNQARERFEGAFRGLRWPKSAKAFRDGYAGTLVAFERRRLASRERAAIAKFLVDTSAAAMVFEEDGRQGPLAEHLAVSGNPLPTETVALGGDAGFVPELTFRGERYQGERIRDLADDWRDHRWMTDAAHRGIRWSVDAALASGGRDLAGHKMVSLGAGAELSPTRAALRAGAHVLFIDTREPGDELRSDPSLSGTLTYAVGGADLLTQPRAISATIRAFAGDDPVHVGMYAYSGGAAKEWRLTAAMNAIVRSLPAPLVRSVVALVSPTTPATVTAEDAEAAAERLSRRRLRRALGLGSSPAAIGQSGELPHRVSHSIVGLQGAAYQAAQYIGKMMTAEALATYGLNGTSPGSELLVSAPVAPITKTASLSHPVFDAGFAGADLFDILVSEPQTTRVLAALLAFHDLLCPEAPSRLPLDRRVDAMFAEQIHGGVYAQPHSLERSILVSAAAGLVRNPSLLGPAVRFGLGR